MLDIPWHVGHSTVTSRELFIYLISTGWTSGGSIQLRLIPSGIRFLLKIAELSI